MQAGRRDREVTLQAGRRYREVTLQAGRRDREVTLQAGRRDREVTLQAGSRDREATLQRVAKTQQLHKDKWPTVQLHYGPVAERAIVLQADNKDSTFALQVGSRQVDCVAFQARSREKKAI